MTNRSIEGDRLWCCGFVEMVCSYRGFDSETLVGTSVMLSISLRVSE